MQHKSNTYIAYSQIHFFFSGYQKTQTDGPGISDTAMQIIDSKIKLGDAVGKMLLVNLVMDEMSIRKLCFTKRNGTVNGFVKVGFDVGLKEELASEALMFLVTAINDHFKLPVSYHFTAGLTAANKKFITTQVLMALYNRKITVAAITFDGTQTNLKCVELMGAELKKHNMRTTIPHPSGVGIVCTIMDAVHMLKLVRNTFAAKGVLYDDKNREIKFEYLVALDKYQEQKGVHLGNKLRRSHIQFSKNKMKSKLAIQLFSNSVADAIEYLLENNVEEFRGSRATIEFIRTINNLFDIMNSKSKYGLDMKNFPSTFDIVKGISQLTLNQQGTKKFLLDSANFTGIFGLLVNI